MCLSVGYIRTFSTSLWFMVKSVLFKGKIYSDVEGQIRDRLEAREAVAAARMGVDFSTKIGQKMGVYYLT